MRHFCLFLVLLALAAACEAKQVAVVVDKANATTDIPLPDLLKILKGETHKWPDGKNVVVVLRDLSTPEMQTALQKVYRMQPEELKAMIAAHKGAIVVANSEEELLKMVASTPGAIGLVDVYSITNHVNVLKVDGKLPLQPGYILKGN